MVWEILSFGKIPYGHQEYEEVLKRLKNGYRLSCPEEVNEITSWNVKQMYENISTQCFVADPKKRANFRDVGKIIEEYLPDAEKKQYDLMCRTYQKTRAEKYIKIGNKL